MSTKLEHPLQLLRATRLEEAPVLPEKLSRLSVDDSLSKAMEFFTRTEVVCMPVFEQGTLVGLLDIGDIVRKLVNFHWDLIGYPDNYKTDYIWLGWRNSTVRDAMTPLAPTTPAAGAAPTRQDRPAGATPAAVNIGGGPPARRPSQGNAATVAPAPVPRVRETDTFEGAASAMLASSSHYVLVMDEKRGGGEGGGAPDSTGSAPRLVNIVTQSAVVDLVWFCRDLVEKAVLNRPVADFVCMSGAHGTSKGARATSLRQVVRVCDTTKAIQAFRVIIGSGVTAVPVVDAGDRVVGTISMRDIQDMASDCSRLQDMYNTDCVDFSMRAHRKRGTGADKDGVCVTLSSTLGEVVQLLHNLALHRLWVVDYDHRLISVVAVIDVIKEFFR
eukprot:jgi/Mesvir1/28934/Mv17718-RA.1